MIYELFRKILFRFPPETAHHLSLGALRYIHVMGLTNLVRPLSTPQQVMGLTFFNPVGLGAGFDKDGEYIEALAALGFGFIEIGTVTPKPQAGNPSPRLFRLPSCQALINRMGLNSRGLDYVEAQLKKTRFKGVLGINIGKNRDTPLEEAVSDYVSGFKRMAPFASYIVINISSPNMQGLRDLQQAHLLTSLLQVLKKEQGAQKKYVPLVLKVAPDLSCEEIRMIAEILLAEKIDGLIATNTTVRRAGVEGVEHANETGGLSGKPLLAQSTKVLKKFHEILQDKVPIIASGGIMSGEDAREKIMAGATLIQIYTGLIYHGPALIPEIIATICNKKIPGEAL